jgi:Rps23 Pro-64 3,4-dihydroxylase Tpa1-like proline 4-hydroxylase
MKYLNFSTKELMNKAIALKNDYIYAKPFPNIVLDNFFNEECLNQLIENFPKNTHEYNAKFDNKNEKKLSLNNPNQFNDENNNFINFLNSFIFTNFLQIITDINETLIPDPYLVGGGLHELKNDGYLNIHADFNTHPKMKLDRRLNVLIYLNKNWSDENGGQLELWNKEMTKCYQSILPKYNRMVIFSTTTFSYHGNPNKVKCLENTSRKSLALYYYSNGRPSNEIELGNHSTIFRKRPGTNEIDGNIEFKKLFGKFYIRTKNKK